MDPVTLGMAKGDAANRYGGASQAAILMQILRAGNENAVVVILGDSTGNETFEWPYLVATWLGQQYPAYTVTFRTWNDGGQVYDAPTTIQTGTGANTLAFYNGSTPGMITDYSVTRLALQAPVTPHLVIHSYGYNEGTGIVAPYRYKLYDLTRRISDRFPAAGIIVTAQPPAGTGSAINKTDAMLRGRLVAELAASEGYGLINMLQTFLDNPTYEADWINATDHLHPVAAGQNVWAAEVKKELTRASRLRPRTPVLSEHRKWIDAASFMAVEGAPVLALQGAAGLQFATWSFDQTTQQGIAATIDYPDSWLYVNVYVCWTYLSSSGFTGANNGLRWGLSMSRLSTTGPWPSPAITALNGTQNAYSEQLVLSSASNSGPWLNVIARGITNSAYISRPLMLRVRRLPTDAVDTMAESAYLRGVMIERAG